MKKKSRLRGRDRSDGPDRGKGKKLLEQMRDVMRVKHYSFRTEQTYCDWVERFILFHARGGGGAKKGGSQAGSMRYVWRHPRELGAAESQVNDRRDVQRN